MTEGMNVLRGDEAHRNGPKVSVVVPVHNRPRELRRLLSGLARQDYPMANAEVLICDDGSTEKLATIVDEFNNHRRLHVIHLHQSRRGAGAARNLGLDYAAGEIVAFTDSDCEPDRHWLAELVRPFEDPSVGIVGGLIDYRAANHVSGRCVNFLMSSTLGAGGARDPRSAIHMKFYPRAGNLAVRRDLARIAGGFPTSSHGEDLEFSDKVLQAGTRAEFTPSAKVLHNENRTLVQVTREAFRKGVARVRLTMRRRMHELIHTLPALLCLYLAALCVVLFVKPELFAWSSIAAILYAVVLVVLALQGAIAMKSVPAGFLVPLYALAMHLGYGLGYLFAWAEVLLKSVPGASRGRSRSGQLARDAKSGRAAPGAGGVPQKHQHV